jgi:GNAT superfamily N-acetyltransferase
VIRPPAPDELERLQQIERAAGQAFVAVGMPEIAADDPLPVAVLEGYRAAGRAWVITCGGVAGYVLVDVLDRPGPPDGTGRDGGPAAHVEQVSVDPAFARRGLGARLIDHVADTARRDGMAALTLTTFRDVPWNGPYYERLGFRPLGDHELGPGLRGRRDLEAAHGLDPAHRVCMRRDLRRSSAETGTLDV